MMTPRIPKIVRLRAKQIVVGDPQDHVVLRERLPGAEVDGERSRDGEEHYGGDERP